jgi:hypothetical protein
MRLWGRRTNGESSKALEEALSNVDKAEARNPEVYEVAGSLRRLRERNHFAEQIYIIMTRDTRGTFR